MTNIIGCCGNHLEGLEKYFPKLSKYSWEEKSINVEIFWPKKSIQPYDDEEVFILSDGEIYVRKKFEKKVKKILIKNKIKQEELLAKLYKEFNEKCLKFLSGNFLLLILDKKNKKFIAARDRIGLNSLYYLNYKKTIIFSSQIQDLVKLPFIKREIDSSSLYDFFTLRFTLPPKTLFKSIYKLPAGCFLLIDLEKIKMYFKKYWDVLKFSLLKENLREETIITTTNELLKEICCYEKFSEPIGIFLSGGIDSSTILAYLNENSNDKIYTFTVNSPLFFKNSEDAKYGKFCANYFNTFHNEIFINCNDIIQALPSVIHALCDLIAEPSCIPIYFLAKKAHENGIRRIYTGDGGNLLFGGLVPPRELLLHKFILNPFYRLPFYLKRKLVQMLDFTGKFVNSCYFFSIKDRFKRLLEIENFPSNPFIGFNELEKKILLSDLRIIKRSTYRIINELFSFIRRSKISTYDEFLQIGRILELKNRLPELAVARVHKLSSSFSLKIQLPFLNPDIIEYELKVPPFSLHMKNWQDRYIIRKLMKGRLPEMIRKRKRLAPILILNKDLKSIIQQEILNPFMLKFFNENYIKKLLTTHNSWFVASSDKLWILFTFALWYKYWIIEEKFKY